MNVWYTSSPDRFQQFKAEGFQVAAGVPFMIGEPPGNFTFRIGLFGLDKIMNKDRTIKILEGGLDKVLANTEATAVAA